ncbi:MAG: hypothetical protein ACOYUB_00585 [Patescibacteria group bacterium]
MVSGVQENEALALDAIFFWLLVKMDVAIAATPPTSTNPSVNKVAISPRRFFIIVKISRLKQYL